MEVGRRRGTTRNGVVAGSVWESRMKIDEVKGGIKVFNGEENPKENGDNTSSYKRVRPKPSIGGVSGKRKTWKSESFEGFERSPIQIARQRSELSKTLDDQCKELSVSADGIKRNPIQVRKTRSEVGKELRLSVDGVERSPTQTLKARSLSLKGSSEVGDGNGRNSVQFRKVKSESNKALGDSSDGNERNPELRKAKSEGSKALDESGDGNERNSVQLMEAKFVSDKVLDEPGKSLNVFSEEIEKDSAELGKAKLEPDGLVDEAKKGLEESVEGIEKARSDEVSKVFGVCEEKFITSNLNNASQAKSPPQLVVTDDNDDGDEEDWDEELEEEADEEIEIEVENKSCNVKEINIPEQKPEKVIIEENEVHQNNENTLPISPIVKKQPPVVKSQQSNERPLPISPVVKKQSPSFAKSHQCYEKSVPSSPIAKKQPPPIVNHSRIHPNITETKPIPVSDEFRRIPQTHSKLQSLVDLVMWRDVSRSAFVFGIGTFIIVSSSYTKDLNISLISVVSYLGLVYLAAIFLFRSIICRGAIDIDDTSQDNIVGEEEAVWLLKLVLPYLNEFLLKLRALFSGDPATTMKLAVLLFVLARCGSSITIWKMAKLGFFGVFTVPKVFSSYSAQLTAYGTFWVRRFRDAWGSCSHKKAVAFAIFTLVWNLSSIVARIWAVFMLFVAFRYYQQSLMREEWAEDEATRGEDSWQGHTEGHRQGRGPTLVEMKKTKKGS